MDDVKAERLFIIFDGPPGPNAGRFVEVEDAAGKSVNVAAWTERDDGTWALGPFTAPRRCQQPLSDLRLCGEPAWGSVRDEYGRLQLLWACPEHGGP